jgi:hypothetical protein
MVCGADWGGGGGWGATIALLPEDYPTTLTRGLFSYIYSSSNVMMIIYVVISLLNSTVNVKILLCVTRVVFLRKDNKRFNHHHFTQGYNY